MLTDFLIQSNERTESDGLVRWWSLLFTELRRDEEVGVLSMHAAAEAQSRSNWERRGQREGRR